MSKLLYNQRIMASDFTTARDSCRVYVCYSIAIKKGVLIPGVQAPPGLFSLTRIRTVSN